MSEAPYSTTEDFTSGVKIFEIMTEKTSWNEDVPEVGDYKPKQWMKNIEYILQCVLLPWKKKLLK